MVAIPKIIKVINETNNGQSILVMIESLFLMGDEYLTMLFQL